MSTEFKALSTLKYWCQKVLPLVYDDSLSYYELLCKVVQKLNDLIINNNELPQYILDLIKEYINGDEFQKIMADLLSNLFLNVKYPPEGIPAAVGDGTKDDTESIQGCIDYASEHGGLSIFIPSGKYSVQPLTLKSDCSMYGVDRYTTKLVLKGGATSPLLSGTVENVSIIGLGFDGNAEIQVNNLNLMDLTVNSAILENLYLTGGEVLLNITVNNDLQICNVIFNSAVNKSMVTNGNGFVQANNLVFNSISTLSGETFLQVGTNKSIFEQIKCLGSAPIAVVINGNDNVVNFWNDKSSTPYTDNGNNNNVVVYTISKKEKFSGDISVSSANSTENIAGDKTVIADDMALTTTGDYTESVGLDKTVEVHGNNTLNITGNNGKTVKGNDTETVTGKKESSVTGDYVLNATKETFNASDIVLNPTNPLTYREPQELNGNFDYVPMKDANGIEYQVLVYNGKPFNAGNNNIVCGYCIVEKDLPGSSGNCAFIKTIGNDFYIFDLGASGSFETIKEQLVKAGCSKIKAVIISHYDSDHVSDITLWKAAFDMTETVFYMPLTTTKFPETETALNTFKEAFPSNEFIFPENNSSYTFNNAGGDNFNIEFNNCGEAVRNYYDLNTTVYNDYSMCAYVVHGNDVMAYVGDISDVAQKYMYEHGMGKKVTAITAPHHAVNVDEGYQPLWRIWVPQFIYVSNNYEQYNLTGMRSPMLAICRNYGAKIAASAENKNTVLIISTGNGIIQGDYYPALTSWYADQMVAQLYVDETYDGEVQNGNQDTPFKDLQRAINAANGFPTQINIVKWSKNVAILWKENLTLDLGGQTLTYLTLLYCKNVIIQNGTINNFDFWDNLQCKVISVNCPKGFVQTRGLMYWKDCTVTNTVDVAFTFNNCYAVIDNGDATVNKAVIQCNNSVVTGGFVLSGFHKGDDTARLIWITAGDCLIGRQDDATETLTNQLWYFSSLEPYKKELLFDTTNNRYCYIEPTGTLKYLAFQSDITDPEPTT